jgi:hypothetical protein
MRGRFLAPLLALLLASAIGAAGSTGSAGPYETARELMSAVLAVKQWALFAYHLQPPGPHVRDLEILDPVFNDDGSFSQTFLLEDGTDYSYVFYPDQHYTEETDYPDGSTESRLATPVEFFEPAQSWKKYHFTQTQSTGVSGDYTVEFFFQETSLGFWSVTGSQHEGTVNFSNKSVHFSLDRDYVSFGPDHFTCQPTASAQLALTVPFDFFFLKADLTRPTTGTLTLGSRTLGFSLFADHVDVLPQWDRLTVGPLKGKPKANEPNGTFLLGSDFSGRGQLFRGRKLSFVARWNAKQIANIIQPNGLAGSAGPAAGLVDLANIRWSGLASGLGPAPGL